jgi:hypothetical protein
VSDKTVVVKFDEHGLYELGTELGALLLVTGGDPLPVDAAANHGCAYSKVNSACVKANTSCNAAVVDSICATVNATCGSPGLVVDAICAGLNASCDPAGSGSVVTNCVGPINGLC